MLTLIYLLRDGGNMGRSIKTRSTILSDRGSDGPPPDSPDSIWDVVCPQSVFTRQGAEGSPYTPIT